MGKAHKHRNSKARDPRFLELLETLLAHGADTRFSLHSLCTGMWHDHIEIGLLDRLLEKSDINETDIHGCTALHYLVKHLDQVETARHLISRGADVTITNHDGNTPLHEVMNGSMLRRLDEQRLPDPAQPLDAPRKAREELIGNLVGAGGDMDWINWAGKTPRMLLEEGRERAERNRRERDAAGGGGE
ncbi:hypothetical protein BDW59DRAFT_163809 [Aspergillus cavernicola]|uniref:Ankyrin repeat-containing domain protein n=1 Tax=Aspergillus cavernicola TaxID=176166 RepID=A0ABR4I3A0_9EURO